ncbi:MAG: DNA-binding response regulator [Chloroflexi bacterium]|nr:MAG: hypothetical protein CUN54_06630 [Phototrophicales bacterium]RMF81429.1 MAG: DNA-binding response regulator [Chloroflexota bacterium]
MKYQWNWVDFFRQDIQPPFVIDTATTEHCHDLFKLSFMQGLEVIVTSIPTFEHNQWVTFRRQLATHCEIHKQVDYWLLVGQLIRDYLGVVENLLSNDIEQATSFAQHLLNQKSGVEQFALIACVYHYAQNSIQAQMMLQYLLQNYDLRTPQMQDLLNFYHNLTERQKDVSLLVAYGLTNQEIADKLYIESSVVAEHLTTIFSKFHNVIEYCPDRHGTRYRLIHWLTYLLIEHPYLEFNRAIEY